jgi:tRNA uracil 4-sulfurtransferase
MLRVAERIALQTGALALVTGEALGQVASQTLQNLSVIDQAAAMPVLRPLVGMDKLEIIDAARALGTYELSIVPDKDCCQLFVPPGQTTVARLEQVLEVEARIDVPALVALALEGRSVEHLALPGPAAG